MGEPLEDEVSKSSLPLPAFDILEVLFEDSRILRSVKTTKKESKPAPEENGVAEDAGKASGGKTAHDQAQDDAVARMVAKFTTKQEEQEVDKLFRALVKLEGSDLHLKVGKPPIVRVNGTLKPLNRGPIEICLLYTSPSPRD